MAKKKRVSLVDMGEDIECLCQIMTTVGKRLDKPKAKVTIYRTPLRDLVLLVEFKKREKSPWKSVTFTKSNTPPQMLFTFLKLFK